MPLFGTHFGHEVYTSPNVYTDGAWLVGYPGKDLIKSLVNLRTAESTLSLAKAQAYNAVRAADVAQLRASETRQVLVISSSIIALRSCVRVGVHICFARLCLCICQVLR